MDEKRVDDAFSGLMEKLAAIEHDRWSHWQRYMHEKGELQADGSLILPSNLVRQWDRLINTSYQELTETEKESDREQVRRYIPTIVNNLDSLISPPQGDSSPRPGMKQNLSPKPT
jgi:hypothetical protein